MCLSLLCHCCMTGSERCLISRPDQVYTWLHSTTIAQHLSAPTVHVTASKDFMHGFCSRFAAAVTADASHAIHVTLSAIHCFFRRYEVGGCVAATGQDLPCYVCSFEPSSAAGIRGGSHCVCCITAQACAVAWHCKVAVWSQESKELLACGGKRMTRFFFVPQ